MSNKTDESSEKIFNVGNEECISIRDWVRHCYAVCGKVPDFIEVYSEKEFRKFFPFYNYEYKLDVSKQKMLFPSTMPLKDGIKRAFDWYKEEAHQKGEQKAVF